MSAETVLVTIQVGTEIGTEIGTWGEPPYGAQLPVVGDIVYADVDGAWRVVARHWYAPFSLQLMCEPADGTATASLVDVRREEGAA